MMASSKLLIADLVSSGIKQVPERYIRPISDRPNLSGSETLDDSIPLIDLSEFNRRACPLVVNQIGQACRSYGFFMVKNHGVPEGTVKNMMCAARSFFSLSESERLNNYSDDADKPIRLSTSFNIKTEKVSNWRDYLRLQCYPLEQYMNEWPSNPPFFRNYVAEYCVSVRALVLKLLEAISESLGLEKECISGAIGHHGQHMAINYYPPCPQPELTYGLPGHTDPNLITVLLQDEVDGLQVMKDGNWVSVAPVPNTFIVNIGDQMQVISNDRYKSVLHRALVSNKKDRISIPTFYCPSADAVIQPAKKLTTGGDPAIFKGHTYRDYVQKFWDGGLSSQSCLDLFRISAC